jgi:uncharacterized protein YacL
LFRKTIFFVLVLGFGAGAFSVGFHVLDGRLLPQAFESTQLKIGFMALTTLVGIVAGVILSPWLIRGSLGIATRLDIYLQKAPPQDLVMGSVGLIFGLIIANLFGWILSAMGWPGRLVWILGSLLLAYLGMSIGIKKREELVSLFSNFPKWGREKGVRSDPRPGSSAKVLDTSVIIDGRIADLCESGFIEGVLLVPAFVLEELRHIADSPDLLKRNRGRRGLDILNKIRKENTIKVQIYDNVRWLDDTPEVDSKLVKMAERLGARVMTNDFNLNKVAELHGVKVLNINDLANAVKPVVLPGEEMVVQVVKDGKEMGQGVAYLDDGTMIVVDGGRRYINQTVPVMVTSVLQTSAGRMIFAKLRNGMSPLPT